MLCEHRADVSDDPGHIRAIGVGQNEDAPLGVLARDLVRPVVLDDAGECRKCNGAGGRLDLEVAQALRRAVAIDDAQDDVVPPASLDDLGDDAAVDKAAQRLCNGGGCDAMRVGGIIVYGDLHLRDAHLALDRDVDEPWDGLEPRFHLLGQRAQRIEVVAEDLERDLRTHARQHMVEPVRDRLAHVDVGRQDGKPRPDIADDLLAAPLRGFQIDVDLSRVHALGMLVELGAARATAYSLHLGHLQDEPLGDKADLVGFGQRDARPEQHRDSERALVEGRQEGTRQVGRGRRRGDHGEQGGRHDEHLPAKGPAQQAPVAGLQEPHKPAVPVCHRARPRQQVVAQDRGHCDGGD